MRIIVTATSFPRGEADHAGRFVLDLSRGFAERGHSVHHIVPGAKAAPSFERIADGMTVERVAYGRFLGLDRLTYGDGIGENVRRRPHLLLGVPLLERAMKKALNRALDQVEDTVVLAHWAFPSGLWSAEVARPRGVRLFICEHGGGVQALARTPGGRRLFRRAIDGAEHFFAVSADLLAKARDLASPAALPPTTIRPMGLDLDAFTPRGRRTALRREILGDERSGTTTVVASVGRLVKLKGHDLLVRAAAEIDDLEVWLIGDGPERAALEALAESRGARVRFFGHLDHARLGPLLEAADIACFPSRIGPGGRTEGAPVSLVEAFTAGLGAIGSRTGGIGETIKDDRNGLLFSPDDAQALRAILLRVRADHALVERLGRAARAAAAYYDRKVVAAAFLDVIERGTNARERTS